MSSDNVSRFNISVNDSFAEEIFSSLDDLSNDGDGFLLDQLAMPGKILKKISFGAIFCNKKIVLCIFVHILKFDDVRMRYFLENVYLVVQHLHT